MRSAGSIIALALAALVSTVLPAPAQSSYPVRPVRVILPFAAGGVADIVTRVVTDRLGEKLGQRMIVENMPGAGGINAARAALSAVPDGYTLALLANATAASVGLFKALPYDPVNDFVPVSSLGYFDFVIATNAGSNFKTMKDVLDYAKKNPGELNVGIISVGSSQHLAAELFKSSAELKFQIIPYRSTPEVIVAALRNDAGIILDSYSAMKANLVDGKLRAVATTGETRSALLKDVPTLNEAGVPGYGFWAWNALFAPKGTPKEVVDKLNAGLREVLAMDDVKARLLELGIEAKASTPKEIHDRLKSDIVKWGKVIDEAGIVKQ